MTAAGQGFGSVRRRSIGAWLLFVFLMAQAVPLVALGATDGMAGMACCKKGKDSCCRRKPMQSPPSFRAAHPCGIPCCGVPTVPLQGSAAVTTPTLSFLAQVEAIPAIRVTGQEARASAGVDPSLYQRPPPFSQA
ncbi:MAG: hypothetical protein ACKV2U_07275 [Bryobacteraceae bacterium]